MKHLTRTWSSDAYLELAAAAVAEAFRVYLRQRIILYALSHPSENYATMKKCVVISHRAARRNVTVDVLRQEAETEAKRIEQFVNGKGYAMYTEIPTVVFFNAAERGISEWLMDGREPKRVFIYRRDLDASN